MTSSLIPPLSSTVTEFLFIILFLSVFAHSSFVFLLPLFIPSQSPFLTPLSSLQCPLSSFSTFLRIFLHSPFNMPPSSLSSLGPLFCCTPGIQSICYIPPSSPILSPAAGYCDHVGAYSWGFTMVRGSPVGILDLAWVVGRASALQHEATPAIVLRSPYPISA